MDADPRALAALGPVRQLGHVVENLDQSIAAWQHKLGVGPWTIMRNITLDCLFRGAPSQPQIDIALAYRGELQIELIQQRNAADSPYREHIEQGRYGLHHIAFLSADIDADVDRLQRAGLTLLCDIRMPMGGRYVYFAPPLAGEHQYIELLEANAMMRQMFAKGIADAREWQGAGRPLELDLALPLKIARALSRLFRLGKGPGGPAA